MHRKKTFLFILSFLLLAFGILALVFDVYYVATGSMEPNLLPGDLVLVNNFSYGYRRVSGSEVQRYVQTGKVQRGDVILFNMPVGDSIYKNSPHISFFARVKDRSLAIALADTLELGKIISLDLKSRTPFFKRVIALARDTLELKDGQVFINGYKFKEGKNIKPDTVATGQGLVGLWDHKWVFPHDQGLNWGYYTFGPLVIPGKGDVLSLSLQNLPLYERLIRVYEGNRLTVEDGHIYINGKPGSTYRVKQDYFFVMGDNRKDSFDSRMWGLVPFDHVIGKASFVLASQSETRGFRKDRILRPVD